MLTQTDVHAMPESTPCGSSERSSFLNYIVFGSVGGTCRLGARGQCLAFGIISANQGRSVVMVLSHCAVAVSASLSRQ